MGLWRLPFSGQANGFLGAAHIKKRAARREEFVSVWKRPHQGVHQPPQKFDWMGRLTGKELLLSHKTYDLAQGCPILVPQYRCPTYFGFLPATTCLIKISVFLLDLCQSLLVKLKCYEAGTHLKHAGQGFSWGPKMDTTDLVSNQNLILHLFSFLPSVCKHGGPHVIVLNSQTNKAFHWLSCVWSRGQCHCGP